MYDEDYFRKIIGGNYKPSDYYANSTYEPNANVFPSEMYAQCKNSSNSNQNSNSSLNYNTNNNSDNTNTKTPSLQPNTSNNISNSANDNNNPMNTTTRADGNSSYMINITTKNDISVNTGDEANQRLHRSLDDELKKEKEDIIEEVDDIKEDIKRDIGLFKTDFDKYYPEIYRIINPMIEAVVEKNNGASITEDLIEVMAREVYDAVEDDVDVNSGGRSDNAVQVSTQPVSQTSSFMRPPMSNQRPQVEGQKNSNMRPPMGSSNNRPGDPPMGPSNNRPGNNQPTRPSNPDPRPPINRPRPPRRPNNSTLFDLIKILLIRRLIDRRR